MGVFRNALDKIKTTFQPSSTLAYDNTYSHRQLEKHGLSLEKQKTPLIDQRVLFIKNGCPICPKWEEAVREFNVRIRPPGRIRIIEIHSMHPLINAVNPTGTPELYLDGIIVRGATTAEGQYGFLLGLLEDELEVDLHP